MNKLKLIAFYLPQFHPTPENDKWWGKGFTEWTNVTKAKPLFKGHYQPHLPADLGLYDLRVTEVREAQAALAKAYGIYGFCYYHYWFKGVRLLQKPFDEILKTGKPDFPFCLCWANETWSRGWLGADEQALMKQEYSKEDFKDHARWLVKAFNDKRYIRINGQPVFLIYRYTNIPKEIDALNIFRNEIINSGGENPYLIAIDVHNPNFNYHQAGFDDVLAFKPSLGTLPDAFNDKPSLKKLIRNIRHGVFSSTLKIYDYEEAAEMMSQRYPVQKIPCVLVSWDNSPRRGDKSIIFKNCNPGSFGRVLEKEFNVLAKSPPSNDLFFLNGWNEWAEGNYLEPDQKFGLGYLEELTNVVTKIKKKANEYPDVLEKTPVFE